MMRSLYSGVSGLKVHQTRMDVIGNNIANVNTVGFKASAVTFSDILYQTTSAATGPNADMGRAGQNPMQIGLGSSVNSITTNISVAGGSQRTDNPFDIMIEGDSFFVVNNGGSNYFTKAGSFKIDSLGTLCNADGYRVMGWQVDPDNEKATVADAVSPLRIMSAENLYSEPEATKAVTFSGNIDQNDTAFDSTTGKLTAFSFFDSLGNSYTVNVKLTPNTTVGSTSKIYNCQVTNILDSNGESILSTFNTTTKKYEKIASTINFGWGQPGTTYDVDPDTGEISNNQNATMLLGFSAATGKFQFVTADTAAAPDAAALAAADYDSVGFHVTTGNTLTDNFVQPIDVDFSKMTMYANSGTTNISYTKGDIDGLSTGRAVGNMTGCTVDSLGMIYGVYDNGTQKLLGQIAVATFSNPAGLEEVGGSLFAETQNSGSFDGIGKSIAGAGGSFSTGVLEMSNVDLSTEFTNMITTQRGFQANSRIITTSDTLLEELINLKR